MGGSVGCGWRVLYHLEAEDGVDEPLRLRVELLHGHRQLLTLPLQLLQLLHLVDLAPVVPRRYVGTPVAGTWRLPWASCPARQVPHGTQETGTRTSCVRHGCGTLWLRVNTVSRMMPSSLAWSEAMTSCVPGSMRNSRNLTSNAGSAEPPTMPTILRNRLRPTALLLLGRPAEGARRRSVVQSRARVIYKRARTPSASDLPAEQWAPR